jgi:hypothetical protein
MLDCHELEGPIHDLFATTPEEQYGKFRLTSSTAWLL